MIELDKTYNENCLETMLRMADNFIDLTITSPPYDDMRTYEGKSDFNFNDISKELYRVTKEGGVLVWVVGDQTKDYDESGTSFRQALSFKDIGFKLYDTMIYLKEPRGPIGGSHAYYQCHEYMFVLSKGKPKTRNFIQDRKNKYPVGKRKTLVRQSDGSLERKIIKGKLSDNSRRGNVWYYPSGAMVGTKDKIAYEHPATFPERLVDDHIVSWSNEGDIVYDPFMGSGTTGKMAMVRNRHYIGSEINPTYYSIIDKRLNTTKSLV